MSGYVARMADIYIYIYIYIYGILVVKPEQNKKLKNPRHRW